MMQYGVQTFTVRKAQRKGLSAAYLPLAALGISRLEVARIDFTKENAIALKEICEQTGLEIASIQVKPKYIFGDARGVINFCHAVGCRCAVISMLPFDCIFGGDLRFYRFVDSLDAMAEAYEKEGITLAYHHHNWEYLCLHSGERRMDVLLSRTKKIKFVHDTYWAARSGIPPEKQIAAFGDRLIGVHLRDLALKKRGLRVLCRDGAIGDGVIDFSAVLSAVADRDCYLVIEQNSKDPYRDIERSLAALQKIESAGNERK